MTPSFDIVPSDLNTAELSQCLLLMEVGEHHFTYVLFNRSEKKVVALRQYGLETTVDKSDIELLKEITSVDGLLQERVADTVVIYNYADSSLLPEKHFDIDLNKPLMELSHGSGRKGLVLSEKVHGWGFYNIYRIPREVHSLMQQKFAAGKYWHSSSLLLSVVNRNEMDGPVIGLVVYGDKFSISFFNDRRLYLMQTFPYETPEDVGYYLLSVCRRFNVQQEDVLLKLSGLVDEESALYHEILKYFLHVKWESPPDTVSADIVTTAHPTHYFSPLLKMTACV